MSEDPLRVPRHPYGGADPRKLRKQNEYNRAAELLEKEINARLISASGQYLLITYAELAYGLRLDRPLVADILVNVARGHTGLTLKVPPRDLEQVEN